MRAAWRGSGVEVVHRLVAMGAWHMLRTARGERTVDIATARGHGHLVGPLTPVIRHPVPADLLVILERRLHDDRHAGPGPATASTRPASR